MESVRVYVKKHRSHTKSGGHDREKWTNERLEYYFLSSFLAQCIEEKSRTALPPIGIWIFRVGI
jgi:hypothetical protein